VIAKYHHSLMDGVTGAGLAEQLFDLEPTPAPWTNRSRSRLTSGSPRMSNFCCGQRRPHSEYPDPGRPATPSPALSACDRPAQDEVAGFAGARSE